MTQQLFIIVIMELLHYRNFYREDFEDLNSDLKTEIEDQNKNKFASDEHINIVIKEREVLEQLKLLERARWNTYPRCDENYYPIFEVLIVDHCNLNCGYCNHWSNIAEKHFYDHDQLMKDLARLKELYGHYSIKLMGGEPMIHPRIRDIIKNASQFVDEVQILTNGLTLIRDVKKKDYSMLDLFEEYRVKLEITRYPILDYTDLLKKLKEDYTMFVDYEVELGNSESVRDTMQIHGVNINGIEDWQNRHLVCGNSNVTINMREGKIYACPFKACLNIFSKKYGLEGEVEATEEDYIDIYKAKSKEEIAMFTTKGTPACRFCTGDTFFYGPKNHPWRKTTKMVTEWIDEEAIEESKRTYKFNLLD